MASIARGSAPRASDDRRQSNVTPLSSSITLSKPNAVSSTLRATTPAPIARAASTAIQATVMTSSLTPVRSAPARSVALMDLRSVVQQVAPLLAVEDEVEVLQRTEPADRQAEPRRQARGGARIDQELGPAVEHR